MPTKVETPFKPTKMLGFPTLSVPQIIPSISIYPFAVCQFLSAFGGKSCPELIYTNRAYNYWGGGGGGEDSL